MARPLFQRRILALVAILLAVTAVLGCKAAGRAVRVATGSNGQHRTTEPTPPRRDSEPTVTSSTSSPPESRSSKGDNSDLQDSSETKLWVFGVQASPELAAKIGAGGVRGMFDLRKFNPSDYRSVLRKYADLDLGLCMTLRWKVTMPKGRKARGSERIDTPPSLEESKRSMDQVIAFLNTPEAKSLSGKLWVQMYNEIAGGPGRFGEKEEDAMFDYATKLAERIRKEAPHIKICGPALAGIDVLDKDESSLAGISKLRYKRLLRMIQWSIKYGDAVDIHLHAESGAWADAALKTVRRAMDRQPGGKETAIVSFEWSPARFKNRTDEVAVKKTLNDIWKALNDNGVAIAAYGNYWPGAMQKEIYQWKSLADENGKPREPFYSFFTNIAAKQNNSSGK